MHNRDDNCHTPHLKRGVVRLQAAEPLADEQQACCVGGAMVRKVVGRRPVHVAAWFG
jgi:hypothetical protein